MSKLDSSREQVQDEITRIHCNIITHWLNKDAPGKPYAEYEAEDKADIVKLVQQAGIDELELAIKKGSLNAFEVDTEYIKERIQELKGVSNERLG